MTLQPEASTPAPTEPNVAGSKRAIRIHASSAALVSLIVLLGLTLRLWGIGWSLPNAQHPRATYHPDERVNLNAAQTVDIARGQFDTKFYNYGAFYFYLANFAQTFGRGYGLIPATPPLPPDTTLSKSEQMARQAPENAGLFLAGRVMTALLGTATIPLLYALGSRLYRRRTGLAAALLYALAPLAVVHAHFSTVDVPATFFVTLALLFAACLLTTPTRKNYVLAGIACGLCAATKYNTGLVLIAPLAAHLLHRQANPGGLDSALPDSERTACSPAPSPRFRFLNTKAGGDGILLLCGAALLSFLIACPGPLLNWDVFWNGTYPGTGVRYELFVHSREGHGVQFEQTGLGWWYHLVVSLPYGLGVPLLLLSLAGLIYACRKRTQGDVILLAFFLLYFGTTGLSAVRFARYMLPLFPVLCLFAARIACETYANAFARRALPALGAATGLLTALYTVALVSHMAQPDPRDLAAAYLNEHAAPGTSIAFAKIPWFFSPPLSPRFGELAAPVRAQAAQEVTRFQLRISPQEWDPSVLSPAPDYVLVSNLETAQEVDRLNSPVAVAWMQAIPQNYGRKTFGDADVFGLPPNRAIIPEDLLYILPVLTVYERNPSK